VAIVTGAARGIGRSHALLLASLGAQVVVNDFGGEPDGTRPASEPARAVAAEVVDAGGQAVADTNSVASPAGAAAIVRTALDTFGRIDIVINNAGITRGTWEEILGVHLSGTYWVTRAAWAHLRAQEFGRVLNTTSGAGLFGRPNDGTDDAARSSQYAYAAAKMGIVGLTRSLAHDGRPHNINANTISPGAHTRLTQAYEDERVLRWLVEHARPELIAPVAAWLVHEDCSVSGEVFSTSGGHVTRVFMAETRGYTQRDLQIEDVRDNIEVVCSEEGYHVPRSTFHQGRLYAEAIGP
jgi:NAD(P)-dependent dehydrogenase (short-subunit alcohol dehydrogenase family)